MPKTEELLVGTVGTADQFLSPCLWTLQSKKFSQETGPAIKASTDVLDFTTVSSGGPAVETESQGPDDYTSISPWTLCLQI